MVHLGAEINHYPKHIGDWMTATAHLSELEECLYSRMVDQYYARETPLPLDIVACCRLVRAASASAKRAVQALLAEFFTKGADGWHQQRCDEEIANYRERSASASASAQARWSKRNANAYANASETHSDGNASRKPVTVNQEPKVKSITPARKRAIPLPPGFGISDAVRDWAQDKGYGQLQPYLEAFAGRAKASGKPYVDWDQAFMNFIREDWGGIRKAKASAGNTQADKRAKVAEAIWGNRGSKDDIDGTAERIN